MTALLKYKIENLGTGESNSIQLAVGTLLKLENHPRRQFNDRWQLVRISHHGEQPQSVEQEAGSKGTYLTNRFEFIPHFQTYRTNLPQKPRIEGTQTAVVVGPPGEEIYCDNFGRVRVQFHWDRLGNNDDHSSCWIQVAQPWAGEGWGMLAIPRVGQEVVVSFQEGDPDQPVIIGRMYNAVNMPPCELPRMKTQMQIKSKTYKGNGYNSITLDDATNHELFAIHAEKDMDTVVENNQSNTVNNCQTISVKATQTTTIGAGKTTTVITGNNNENILAGDNVKNVSAGNNIRNIQLNDITNVLVGDSVKNVLIGNDINNVKTGDLIETIHNSRSTKAKTIFEYGEEKIRLEVSEQTSITLDNQKILLRFGQSTVLLDKDGVWLDGIHIGLREKEARAGKLLRYQMSDKEGKDPAGNEYVAYHQGGELSRGKTDENGFTESFSAEKEADNIYIHFVNSRLLKV